MVQPSTHPLKICINSPSKQSDQIQKAANIFFKHLRLFIEHTTAVIPLIHRNT